MAANWDILVFTEKAALLPELIAAARMLTTESGGRVIAAILGPRDWAEQAAASGAHSALWLGELPAGRLLEDVVPTLAAAVGDVQPTGILIGATTRGRLIAGRLAARLGISALTDVREFRPDSGGLHATHLVFGGGAVRTDRPLTVPFLATVAAGVFEPLTPDPGASIEIQSVDWVVPPWQAKLIERRGREGSSVNLAAAKKVVCPGRGLKRQEDLVLIEELTRALGAEMACTRPLSEGLNWLPRERYIGISGAVVKPDLYIGVGVSGQAQHTIGMSESRVVVAINKDRNAPLVAQSDYAIEGDLYEVVPALIRAIKAYKG